MFVAAVSVFILVGLLVLYLVIMLIARFIRNHQWTKPPKMVSVESREATLPSFVSHLQDGEIIDERTSFAQTPVRHVSQSASTRVASSPFHLNDDDAEVMHRYAEKGGSR